MDKFWLSLVSSARTSLCRFCRGFQNGFLQTKSLFGARENKVRKTERRTTCSTSLCAVDATVSSDTCAALCSCHPRQNKSHRLQGSSHKDHVRPRRSAWHVAARFFPLRHNGTGCEIKRRRLLHRNFARKHLGWLGMCSLHAVSPHRIRRKRTAVSVEGVGGFDLVFRNVMLRSLLLTAGGDQLMILM